MCLKTKLLLTGLCVILVAIVVLLAPVSFEITPISYDTATRYGDISLDVQRVYAHDDGTFHIEPHDADGNPTDDIDPDLPGTLVGMSSERIIDENRGRLDCGLLSSQGIIDCIALTVNAMFGFFAWLLGGAGVVLNFVVVKTVIQMGQGIDQLGAIDAGWAVFRDLANIVIIFVFLAIGISTILGLEGFSIRKTLAKIIIVALLINFSLFFTQVVVDASNLFSTTIFNQFEQCGVVAPGSFRAAQTVDGNCVTLSDRFQDALTLTSLYKINPDTGDVDLTANLADGTLLSADNIITIGLMGSILFIITTFVFLAAAMLLVIRYVVLAFLMVLSPLAFVGMVLPRTASYAKEWWEKLFRYALFAPLYFILTWFVLTVIEAPGFQQAVGLAQPEAFTATTLDKISSFAIFLNFMIVITFMVASLIIANKFGIAGANTAIKWGHGMRRWGQGVAWRATKGAVRPAGQYVHRQVAGAAERIEKAPEGSVRQRLMDRFPVVPIAGRATRRGLQRTRASYTSEVMRRQREIETLRSGELDRRLKSASGHDFLALVMEKLRRSDLDELAPEQLTRAEKLMKDAGMGTLKYETGRPDAGETEDAIRKRMMKVKEGDISQWHRERIVSLYNDDGSVKWGDLQTAEDKQTQVLKAMYELFDGATVGTLLRRGGQNSTEMLKYAATKLGKQSSDPDLLQAMAADLRDLNRDRITNQGMEEHSDVISRTESAARYLESEAARRAAGLAPQQRDTGGQSGSLATGGGGSQTQSASAGEPTASPQEEETASERQRRLRRARMERGHNRPRNT